MVLPQENGRRELLQGEGIALPQTLTARGFTLIVRAPNRMFAVSPSYGCTGTKETINEVVAEAWGIYAFCEYVNRKRAEDDAAQASNKNNRTTNAMSLL